MEDNIEEKNKKEDNREGKRLNSEELKKNLSELDEFKKEFKECQKLAKEYLTGWQRSRADFLNYKKEEMERIKEILKYSNEELILKILPILDNFKKAEEEIPDDKKNDKFLKGVLQIKRQLEDFLKNQGIENIKTVGEKFDPNFHEIIEEAEVNGRESGMVIEEIQKGYLLNGKVLRPAKVKVSN